MKTLISLLVLASVLFSQDFISAEKPFTKDRLTEGSTVLGLTPASAGLLDPSRFSMHQSYSMGYWSNGRDGDMTGLYLNRLQYDFSIPLSLQVDIGLFHKPMALFNGGKSETPGVENQTLTIPHVGLTYQPSKNIFMAFEYFSVPAGYSNAASPFGSDLFSPLPVPAEARPNPPDR